MRYNITIAWLRVVITKTHSHNALPVGYNCGYAGGPVCQPVLNVAKEYVA